MADNENSNSVVWFLLGGIAGAAVALLFASKTGKDAQHYLAKQSDRQGNVFAQSGREMVERTKDLYDKGRAIADEAADLFERGRKLVKG